MMRYAAVLGEQWAGAQVRDVFEDMVQAGLQPTVVTWNTLLASFTPTGDWLNAMNVLYKVHTRVSLRAPGVAACAPSGTARRPTS